MSQLIVSALVLLTTVGGLLGAAAWNRSGAVQRVMLTERELALPWDWQHGGPDERRALRLRLLWQRRDDPLESRLWLPDLKLRALGFTIGVPAGAPEAASVYGRSLPRTAWVAFEYDGPAWRQLIQRTPPGPGRELLGPGAGSRLVPIDAEVDPDVLRRRYAAAPAPVIVLPAIIEMRHERHPTRGPSVWATVARLAVADVTVPHHLRGRLRPPSPGTPTSFPPEEFPPTEPPRYQVVLGVGRLGAVWVEEIRDPVN